MSARGRAREEGCEPLQLECSAIPIRYTSARLRGHTDVTFFRLDWRLMAPEISVADVETIRRAFPSLARLHEGKPVAYFDGPGGTQVPRAVVDAVADYLLNHNANTHWEYPTSRETDAALAGARAALADYLGGRPDEIVFGNNMTTLTFHLARSLGRKWGPGDEIVVTELDHHANVDT